MPPGGLKMISRIQEWYEVSVPLLPGQQAGSIPWFGPHGDKNCIPHPENIRRHDTVVQEYIESVNEHGVVQDCRGRLYAVQSSVDGAPGTMAGGYPLQLITWGTLGRAFYLAVEQDVNQKNEQIQTSLCRGLSSICVLDHRTPPDVYNFLKWYHNQFHEGQGDSFLQLLSDVPEIEAGFVAWSTTSHPGPRSLKKSESQQVAEYLEERCKGKFNSWNEYDMTKVIFHELRDAKIYQELCDLASKVVNFRSKSCVTHDT